MRQQNSSPRPQGLGGTCTLAADLNDRGQVVGASNLPGDQTWYAFVWDRATGITNLGTLGGSYSKTLVAALNRKLMGWANYFCLGPVSKAYRVVEQHACRRLRQWLCVKQKERAAGDLR